MPFADCVPLFRFLGTLLCPILYIVSFASTAWIKSDNRGWGLWSWCYTNFTDQDDPDDFVNDTQRCHSIDPGDSPGYYEAVRVLACFTLVTFVGYFFTCNDKEGLGKEKRPMVVAAVSCVMSATTLAVLGANFRDDERWKNWDPSLDWCFWLIAAASSLSFAMVFISYKFWDMRKTASGSSGATVTPRPPDTSRSSTSSSSSVATNAAARRRSDPDFSSTARASAAFTKSSARGGASAASIYGITTTSPSSRTTTTATTANSSSNNQFPILNPPPYGVLPPDPVDLPVSPPPSYESVIGNDSTYNSAPPAYIP